MSDLDQFRRDFSLVWRQWIADRHETEDRHQMAGKAVKEHLNEPEWMAGAMNHFAHLADCIRRDQARAERIRAEVRAEKAAKRRAAA